MGQKKVFLHNYGNRTTLVQTVGYSPNALRFYDFRHNSIIIFSLHSIVQGKEKETNV